MKSYSLYSTIRFDLASFKNFLQEYIFKNENIIDLMIVDQSYIFVKFINYDGDTVVKNIRKYFNNIKENITGINEIIDIFFGYDGIISIIYDGNPDCCLKNSKGWYRNKTLTRDITGFFNMALDAKCEYDKPEEVLQEFDIEKEDKTALLLMNFDAKTINNSLEYLGKLNTNKKEGENL